MPRDGSHIYVLPFPDVVEGTPVESAVYNGFTNDVAIDLNAPRPIVAGGTGATSATEARANLQAEVAHQNVTNFDSHVFEAGSFYCGTSTTGAPNAHSFAGFACIFDANNLNIECRDMNDTVVPGTWYTREKKLGVWGSWRSVNELARNLTITKVDPAIELHKTANTGQSASISSYVFTFPRWRMDLGNGDAESDPATGSIFQLHAYDNFGTFRSTPLAINRSDGEVKTTGDHRILKASPQLMLDSNTSSGMAVVGKRNGVSRWNLSLGNGDAESSGNAGSNLSLYRASDDGATIVEALNVNRANGRISVNNSALTATSPTTGTFVVVGGVGVSGTVFATKMAIQSPGSAITGWDTALNIGFVGGGGEKAIATHPSFDNGVVLVMNNAANAQVGSITQGSSSVAYNTTSDERLKEDLRVFDAGNIIDNTNVYDFKWKNSSERAYGVLAQQAVTVYPTAVTHSQPEDWYGVDYSKYVPVTLQELKSLRARVAHLEATPSVNPGARLDAGIAAALDVATAVRDAMQHIPDNFTAVNFMKMKIQLDALTDAFAAMLRAQQAPPP